MNTQQIIKQNQDVTATLINQEKELKELRMFKAKALGYKNQTELYQRSLSDAQKKIKELEDTISKLSYGMDLTSLNEYVNTLDTHS